MDLGTISTNQTGPDGRIKVMKVKITHIDGYSIVRAVPIIKKGEIEFNYRFEGISYALTIPLSECIKIGYVKNVRANNNFRKMKKDKVYQILSFQYADTIAPCNTGDIIININTDGINEAVHVSNFDAAF